MNEFSWESFAVGWFVCFSTTVLSLYLLDPRILTLIILKIDLLLK